MGREGDHGGSEAGGPGGADGPRDRPAGGGGTRAARQDHPRGRRIHGRRKAGHGGGSDTKAAGGPSVAVPPDPSGNWRGEEHDHRVPLAARYNLFIGPRFGARGYRDSTTVKIGR